MPSAPETCDWVVVGSGAGGGTLAARLAEAGARVVLLEAGGDPRAQAARMPDDYDVPAFHAFAAENPATAWNFFVGHHADDAQARRDRKATPQGVLYPRAGTLGGCTAHNAMIFVRPPDSDWDAIAALTGDPSWSAEAMRRRFERLEDCGHRPSLRALARVGVDRSGHGWNGWLPTERSIPPELMQDSDLRTLLSATAASALRSDENTAEAVLDLLESRGDPNDLRFLAGDGDGVCYTPMTTRDHRRVGARERVLDVASRFPDRLHVELHALAIGLLFDAGNRATGVAYLKGERLYRADPNPASGRGEARAIRAERGVVLAGGAFNTPQLLMLSGIGDARALAALGLEPRVDLPGVGRNLQDRYEVGVVSRMARPWACLGGARFEAGDDRHAAWKAGRRGMYDSNGAAICLLRRSRPENAAPDLFCMALVTRFEGYFPGYSRLIAEHDDRLTWCVLKAHTRNRAGTVSLRSRDPRDPPRIEFNYFDPGDDPGGEDLAAVVEGVKLVRRLTERLQRRGVVAEETSPGPLVASDAEIAAWVRDNSWGHHASCSCAIGRREDGGVLDSRLAVHGTTGLHVVDASIFPRIPGTFIASAVYLAAEKAAETLLGRAP